MKMIGARKMIDMPKGTIYFSYWLSSNKQCYELMEDFKNGKIKVKPSSLELFLDNSYSMEYDESTVENQVYNDTNIVGDAGPWETLYVVFDNIDDVVKHIEFRTSEQKRHFISKINALYNAIIKESNCTDNVRARQELDDIINDPYFDKNILLCEIKGE